jgi:hypothetical protein
VTETGEDAYLDAAIKAVEDGDAITAVAWALIDIALSLRDREARESDNTEAMNFPQFMRQVFAARGMAAGTSPAMTAAVCTCGHSIVSHDNADKACAATNNVIVEGVVIQEPCACQQFEPVLPVL